MIVANRCTGSMIIHLPGFWIPIPDIQYRCREGACVGDVCTVHVCAVPVFSVYWKVPTKCVPEFQKLKTMWGAKKESPGIPLLSTTK